MQGILNSGIFTVTNLTNWYVFPVTYLYFPALTTNLEAVQVNILQFHKIADI